MQDQRDTPRQSWAAMTPTQRIATVIICGILLLLAAGVCKVAYLLLALLIKFIF